MDFKSPKELYKFIQSCAKLGVTSVKLGEIQFDLAPRELKEPKKRKSISPGRVEESFEHEPSEDPDTDDNDLRMSQLVVDDFEAYEDMSVRKLKGEA